MRQPCTAFICPTVLLLSLQLSLGSGRLSHPYGASDLCPNMFHSTIPISVIPSVARHARWFGYRHLLKSSVIALLLVTCLLRFLFLFRPRAPLMRHPLYL